MLIPSRWSTLISTNRRQSSRGLAMLGRSRFKKLFLNFRMSRTFSLVMMGSPAAMVPSTSSTFSKSPSLGGTMLALLLISAGSSRSRTDIFWADITWSMAVRLRKRLRFRKLVI